MGGWGALTFGLLNGDFEVRRGAPGGTVVAHNGGALHEAGRLVVQQESDVRAPRLRAANNRPATTQSSHLTRVKLSRHSSPPARISRSLLPAQAIGTYHVEETAAGQKGTAQGSTRARDRSATDQPVQPHSHVTARANCLGPALSLAFSTRISAPHFYPDRAAS
jgi:hypothetical protein